MLNTQLQAVTIHEELLQFMFKHCNTRKTALLLSKEKLSAKVGMLFVELRLVISINYFSRSIIIII